jgi:hypothetical protein
MSICLIHEILNEGKHLESSYLSRENKKPKEESSIYHFDKVKNLRNKEAVLASF